MRFLPVVFLFLIGIVVSRGAERTWDGSGRGGADWTESVNWVNGIVPVPGDSLRFPFGGGRPTNTNDYVPGTDFAVITLEAMGYTLHGNRIDLSGGLAVTHSTGNSIVYLPITLLANQTFAVTQPGATLFLNGDVQMGSRNLTFDVAGGVIVVGDIDNSRLGIRGQLRKQGAGTLWMFQPASYDAPTIVSGGTLRVDGRVTNTFITINSSGTLRGAGRVGSFRAAPGGTVQPGFNAPDVLDVFGDVEFAAGSTYSVRLNSPADYDQLNVRGTVTLGGSLNVAIGYTPAVGEVFTIIDNDGSDDVVGVFAGLPEGAEFTINGRPFKIRYGGRFGGPFGRVNDVTIEAIPALAIWDGQGGLNRRWSLPTNWMGDIIPYPGDDIYFPNPAITTNDFPAGRLFGSIIFGGGINRVDGNPAIFDGRLVIESASDIEIFMPMTLRDGFRVVHPGDLWFGAPLTLSRNQTFAIEHTNFLVYIHQGINMGPYNLTLENQTWDRPGYPTHASFYLYQQVAGSGRLIKEGPGQCRFIQCPILCSETIINEGELSESPFIGGAVTVNGAATFMGNVTGPILVNPGGLWDGGRFLTNVTVNGGTFAPSFITFIQDGLRMVSNATYLVKIERDNSGDLGVTGAGVLGGLELSNTFLSVVQVDSGTLTSGDYRILNPDPAATSTFEGLPEGARLVAGPNALTLSYQGGELFTLTVGVPFVWDGGGGDGYWGTHENWVADVAPLPSHTLVFPASAARRANTNNFPEQTVFNALILEGNSYTLRGNSLRLLSGLSHHPSGQNIVGLGLRFSPSPSTNPQSVFVGNSGFLRLEGAVSNCFIAKTGPGTLRLAGLPNNPQFGLRVREGQVDLAKASPSAAISATLEVGDGSTVAVVNCLADNQIADTSDVVVGGVGRLNLGSNSDAIDGLSGTGVISLGAASLPGSLAVHGGGTFQGAITGTGVLTRAGVGSLTLTGTNTFSGQTIVESGSLQIDGIHTNSVIALNGGLVGGRGRVGAIQGSLGGTLAPGRLPPSFQNYLHTRNVQLNGNIIFQPYILSLSPEFENTRLQVTGTVDLGGSVLDARRGTAPPTNSAFVVIDNDGADPIIGTFHGLPEGAITGADGVAFRVSYVGGTGNDVVLTRVTAPATTLTGIQRLATEKIQIQGTGIPGVRYVVHFTRGLNPPIQWFESSVLANSNGVWSFEHTVAEPQLFYRAVSP